MSAIAGKPLGMKAYGSIPHLPGSRRGPADKGVNEGQARIATERTRDKHDLVIVQEKLDGSNVAVAKIEGAIVPLVRAGHRADTSPYEQHWRFGEWVYANQERFIALLEDGERVCGEWLMQAHGTRYTLRHAPFVAFDLMRGTQRATWDEVVERCYARHGVTVAHTIHNDTKALSIRHALTWLGPLGWHGALDTIEGAVWRVERNGAVDFLCKYVRPDKVDGLYLPGCAGNPKNAEPVWNWRPAFDTADEAPRSSWLAEPPA